MDDFSHLLPLESNSHSPNVLFVSPSCLRSRELLPIVLKTFPSIEWIHCRSAGIDFVYSNEFASLTVPVTNAKGQFSSSLAEYTMMACSYFAKVCVEIHSSFFIYIHNEIQCKYMYELKN